MAGLISSNPDIAMSMDLGVISPQSSDPTDVTQNSISDELLNDLWIGVVLTAMVLSCIGCLCSCFLYHTFRQWQTRVQGDLEANYDTASLPSYTTVGGLPTYEEAMEQQMFSTPSLSHTNSGINTPPLAKLSVGELLEIYKEGVKK